MPNESIQIRLGDWQVFAEPSQYRLPANTEWDFCHETFSISDAMNYLRRCVRHYERLIAELTSPETAIASLQQHRFRQARRYALQMLAKLSTT